MKQLENNAYFWQKLDTLYVSSSIIIDRKKDAIHPKYNLKYPTDYGYLKDTHGSDGTDIDVFIGSEKSKKIEALALCVNILNRDNEIKLLVGCTEEEVYKIMQFLNETEFQKAILIRRSDEISSWAIVD